MIEARAAVFREPGVLLTVETVEFDDPHECEVLVRIVAAALCHSDAHRASVVPPVPLILGHEGAGIVEAVGPGVTKVTPGDKVIFTFIPSCGTCFYCSRGAPVDCERGVASGGELLDNSFRARLSDGSPVGQMTRLGVFSERTIVPEDSCIRVPADADLRTACLLSCGFTTGAGAAINAARTAPGETVIVIGIGGVGASAIQGAVVAGAAEVIAVDLHAVKVELALTFGATRGVIAKGDWVEEVRTLTGGHGADKAILAVPRVTSSQIAQMLAALRKGGTGVIVGSAGAVESIGVNPGIEFVRDHKILTGSLFGGIDPQRDQRRFLDLHLAGRLQLDEMITAVYSLERINEGMDDLRAGKNIRGLLEFTGTLQ